jgi:hypothetical protein
MATSHTLHAVRGDRPSAGWAPGRTGRRANERASPRAAGRIADRRIVDWLVWLPAIAGDWWLRWALFPAKRSSPPIGARSTSVQDDPVDEQLLQQITRTPTAEGREVIHGTLVAELAAGERSATLYVAFCPPFERLPQVEAEATDCPDASVKLIQALHHGAQLEVCLFEVFEFYSISGINMTGE